ncbi:MAG: DUF1579 domain-containing protein [Planctomycetota bacterium]|jgi:hypothetical protein
MTEQATQADACAQAAEVADAHKKFEPFVGTFRANVKMWMGPGDPHVSTGMMINTMDLGGRYLQQRYKGDAADGPFPNFEGRGYWGFNTVSGRYEGFWIDSASTFMQTEAGDVDASGKVWTMIGEVTDPQSGRPMKKKSVITLKDDDHHLHEMFFTGSEGQEWCKAMEIAYTRQR